MPGVPKQHQCQISLLRTRVFALESLTAFSILVYILLYHNQFQLPFFFKIIAEDPCIVSQTRFSFALPKIKLLLIFRFQSFYESAGQIRRANLYRFCVTDVCILAAQANLQAYRFPNVYSWFGTRHKENPATERAQARDASQRFFSVTVIFDPQCFWIFEAAMHPLFPNLSTLCMIFDRIKYDYMILDAVLRFVCVASFFCVPATIAIDALCCTILHLWSIILNFDRMTHEFFWFCELFLNVSSPPFENQPTGSKSSLAPWFRAPEEFVPGEFVAGRACDIWALGVSFWYTWRVFCCIGELNLERVGSLLIR